MNPSQFANIGGMSRRDFLYAISAAGGVALGTDRAGISAATNSPTSRKKGKAIVRAAFVYPPTEQLDKVGYYSWPGSTFDAEGQQKKYMKRIREMENRLGMRIQIEEKPLDGDAGVIRFISQVKQSKPDGLLLIPFKKGHWGYVTRIIDEVKRPTVVLATLGVLLVDHINQLHRKGGVYMISSLDNLDAVESGMRMIRTARWMKEARLVNIRGSVQNATYEPFLGTQIWTIPHARFLEAFQRREVTDAVKKLAQAYRKGARQIVEPDEKDIVDAAKTYFVLKQILEEEQGDAVMMDCLPGLKKPHQHPPPCMGFMSLRDEGIPAGCQSDLNASLSLMLVQQLFDRPGFQQNAAMDMEKNHYFGAHCTSASRMRGVKKPSEPYILRSHAEAGWGCVPRVLFSREQEVTMALYRSGKKPQMMIYSGRAVRCPPIPPTGGCRTNIEMTINEVEDVCDVKGMHQNIFYGNFARQLRIFCNLYNIEVVS